MQRTSVLDNFTQLYMAGVRFDPANLKWVDRENKVVPISINGKRFSEESIRTKIQEIVRAIWDRFTDLLEHLICRGADSHYSWKEAPIMRLYERVYQSFKSHTAHLATRLIYNNRLNLIQVRANRDREPLEELNNQYNAFLHIKKAAKTILAEKNFSQLIDPEYHLASIEPALAVLHNPPVQREIRVP